jgi:hypothetical protein
LVLHLHRNSISITIKIKKMFDDLLKMLQNSGQESVINNPQVPNEHNDGVLQAAGGSILDTLKGMIANGQGDQVAQLANDPNHPAAQQMQNGFVENIMQKFGIGGDAAKGIAASLIPMVLSQLGNSNTAGASAGGFNLSTITSMLGKTGLDKDGDGKLGLGDITKMFGM